jgi:hypothetical protein
MLSAVVLATDLSRPRGASSEAVVRTLSALVPAAIEGIVRDVTLACAGDSAELRKIADHAGCEIVEAADPVRPDAQERQGCEETAKQQAAGRTAEQAANQPAKLPAGSQEMKETEPGSQAAAKRPSSQPTEPTASQPTGNQQPAYRQGWDYCGCGCGCGTVFEARRGGAARPTRGRAPRGLEQAGAGTKKLSSLPGVALELAALLCSAVLCLSCCFCDAAAGGCGCDWLSDWWRGRGKRGLGEEEREGEGEGRGGGRREGGGGRGRERDY